MKQINNKILIFYYPPKCLNNFYGMHPVVYLFKQYLVYQLVSLYNYFSMIEQNKHYCVIICYNATCFDPLLGHPQEYAIQALVFY
jgi:hypothetical protein